MITNDDIAYDVIAYTLVTIITIHLVQTIMPDHTREEQRSAIYSYLTMKGWL